MLLAQQSLLGLVVLQYNNVPYNHNNIVCGVKKIVIVVATVIVRLGGVAGVTVW